MNKNRLKTIALIAAVVLIIGGGSIGWLQLGNQSNTPSNTASATPDVSEPSTTNQTPTPDISTNAYDASAFTPFITAVQTPLPFDLQNIRYFSSSSGTRDCISFINVEDALICEIDNAEAIDEHNLQLVFVPHENMHDPYASSIQQFVPTGSAHFVRNGNTLTAEYVVWYDTTQNELLDVLIVYENNISAYFMLNVLQTNLYSVNYWRYVYSSRQIGTFSVTSGDTTREYCFFADEPTTLPDWIVSDFNVDSLRFKQFYMFDSTKSWMLPFDPDDTLKDKQSFIAQTYDDTLFTEPTFDDTNPDYLVSYIGQSLDTLRSKFGEPNQTESKFSFTRLEYPDFTAYINGQNNVIEIEVLTPTYLPVNGLPAQPLTTMKLVDTCLLHGIDYPGAEYTQNDDGTVTAVVLFQHGDWFISYIWSMTQGQSAAQQPCSRIVIHSTQEIPF